MDNMEWSVFSVHQLKASHVSMGILYGDLRRTNLHCLLVLYSHAGSIITVTTKRGQYSIEVMAQTGVFYEGYEMDH